MARNSRVLRTIPLLIAVCFVSFPAQAQYGGGIGEPNDPYLIYTAEQMNAIGAEPNDWDMHFKLMADIDLSAYTGTAFNIIGTRFPRRHFTGVFDGHGHTISNFRYYTSPSSETVGLFRYFSGQLKDLRLVAPDVHAHIVGSLVGISERDGTITACSVEGGTVAGAYDVGGLVGMNNGTITNCSSSANVSGTSSRIGGLVGSGGTIANCTSSGTVMGDGEVGGLVGSGATITDCSSSAVVDGNGSVGGLVGSGGTITNCYSLGSVTGVTAVGGLAGEGGTIINCYTMANVSGTDTIGGLVGDNNGAVSNCYAMAGVSGHDHVGGLVGMNGGGVITHCYSTSSVTGTMGIGGLVGLNDGGLVHASFWDTQTSGQPSSDGGTGKTTAEMQMASTFVGWGSDPVWTIDEGVDYPRLSWENMPGETITTPSAYEFLKGNGIQNDPYLIYTAEEFNAIGLFAYEWGKHFKLMADINLSGYTGTDYNIIGRNEIHPFTGVFDGNGNKIVNFTYTSINADNIGLFGCVADPNAQIKDVVLTNPRVDARAARHVGTLVGSLSDAIVINCYAEGGSMSGWIDVGGLVGRNYGSTIIDCNYSGNVSGYMRVGGLVGVDGGAFYSDSLIENCHASASVEAELYVGGLVGDNNGAVSNCYSRGSVIGNRSVGGLLGNNGGTIKNCYASGAVTATGDSLFGPGAGGLVGVNTAGTIRNCYSVGSVMGVENVGGLVGKNSPGWPGEYGIIIDCYSLGSVTGQTDVGGLVGANGSHCVISNCYSAGSVAGTTYVGGLVGLNDSGRVYRNCFWDTQTSGQPSSQGGAGKTTAELQMASTFVAWGCGPVWTINEGNDYPRLWWENAPGEVISPMQPGDLLAGSGTEDDPFLIYTSEELVAIGRFCCDWDKQYRLMADIDLSGYTGTEYNIIGRNEIHPFTGVFDGNGHEISNFTYTCNGVNHIDIGLFGYVDDPNAEIKYLGLIDPNIDAGAGQNVGSLVGSLSQGTITGCYVEGGSVSGHESVGALVGYLDGTVTGCYAEGGSVVGGRAVGGLVGRNFGTVSNCYSSGTVSGSEWVGGLVGRGHHGSIKNCRSSARVLGNRSVGGLVGYGDGLMNCYSTGSVWGEKDVGGLTGGIWTDITNCYFAGEVGGSYGVGGLAGKHRYNTTIANSLWDIQTSGLTNMCGSHGDDDATGCNDSYGKTTAEMQTASTFLDAGWDFVDETANGTEDIWWIDEGQDYPRLWWELIPEN